MIKNEIIKKEEVKSQNSEPIKQPEIKLNVPEIKSNVPELKPNVVEVKSNVPEIQPTVPEIKPNGVLDIKDQFNTTSLAENDRMMQNMTFEYNISMWKTPEQVQSDK